MDYWEYRKARVPEVYKRKIEEALNQGDLTQAGVLSYFLGKNHADSPYFDEESNLLAFLSLTQLDRINLDANDAKIEKALKKSSQQHGGDIVWTEWLLIWKQFLFAPIFELGLGLRYLFHCLDRRGATISSNTLADAGFAMKRGRYPLSIIVQNLTQGLEDIKKEWILMSINPLLYAVVREKMATWKGVISKKHGLDFTHIKERRNILAEYFDRITSEWSEDRRRETEAISRDIDRRIANIEFG